MGTPGVLPRTTGCCLEIMDTITATSDNYKYHTNNTSDFLAVALGYVTHRRWAIFPCKPRSKYPAFKGSFHNATTNPETIRRWWGGGYKYNIALATGHGLFVLDEDPRHDGDVSLRRLEAEHGPLPDTLAVITVQGGVHRYFRVVGEIRGSAGVIGPGLDVRGDGGYVMLPSSVWENGRAYTWSVDSTNEIAEAPQWLIDLARKKPALSIRERALAAIPRPNGIPVTPGRYGLAALEYEIEILANTAPGGRNHQLNSSSFSLYQLVAGGELDDAEVERRLIEACCQNGLMEDRDNGGPRKIAATINSGKRSGLLQPRSRGGV